MPQIPASSTKSLRQITNILVQQKRKRNEYLKHGVTIVPVSDEVLEKLVGVVGDEHESIMSLHPGHDIEGKIKSLQTVLDTYRRSHADLMTRLDEFDVASKDGTLFYRPRGAELKKHEEGCRKEIFALSSAAAALVDHARRVTKCVTIPQFDEIRAKNFDSGQHVFIKELRNELNHLTFHEAGWSINIDWSNRDAGAMQSSHFEFKSATLLRNGKFNAEAQKYIRGQEERIDVRNLFETYGKSVSNFYAWVLPEIEARLPAKVQDYRRCIRVRMAHLKRSTYRLLLAQVTPETDLNSHLSEYLTPEEWEEINALPDHSKQRIDRIIEIVDEDGACDDELRGLVYKAFGL